MIPCLLLLSLCPPVPAPQEPAPDESTYYAVDYLTPPDGARLEVGGMDFLPDGRLLVSTRRGEVWQITNPLASDPADARFQLFADGLWEGLGLNVHDGEIYVLQRGELSRLRDEDGDGVCDTIDTVADGWGLAGHYHEFAFGLPNDDQGRFYMSLNVSFGNPEWWHGRSAAPYRGWILRVEKNGSVTPLASGARSPCGLGFNAAGDLFYTDNQGDWMPACPIFHVREGDFYGHPAGLRWTPEYLASQTLPSDRIPPERAHSGRARAAVWLPYKWSRSTGNLTADSTGGKFGPFDDQLFVGELTNGMVLRTQLEKVQGEYQGAAFLFRQNIGSVTRVEFAPDGTLFCGMTNRGWGGAAPDDGIARVRWTGVTPFEMKSVHLLQDGFEIELTEPAAADATVAAADVQLSQYDYDLWWEYGSPERAMTAVPVASAEFSADRTRLVLRGAELVPGKVARCLIPRFRSASGATLLHEEFNYTINELPEGPPTGAHVAKVVPPPPLRSSEEAGWLRLTYGDAIDAWNAVGWELCAAALDPDDPTQLATEPGNSHLANTGSDSPSDYVSKTRYGDAKVHVEFMLPESGTSGLLLQGRYEIRFADSKAQPELTLEHCGAVAAGATWPGAAPLAHPYYGAGNLLEVDVDFRAPRFDASGNKLENARIVSLKIDDILVHEDLELPEPSASARFPGESAEGPLVIVGTRSDCTIGNIRVFPLDAPAAITEEFDASWTRVLNTDESFDAWTATGGAIWSLEDGILTAEGPRGYLLSPRSDYGDFELTARVKISDGGNAGLLLRAADSGDAAALGGYQAEINSSFPDPQKTGSVRDLAPVLVQLVSQDTWFEYRMTCRDEAGGTRIRIAVNGVWFTDYLDTERRFTRGHVAIEQNHDGSVLELSDIAIREL